MSSELYIGVLSGTSVDGIDAALVRFDGRPELVASHALSFPVDLRKGILALCVPGEHEIDRLGRIDVELGRWFATAVRQLLAHARVDAAKVRAIGSHGQTIRHRPGFKPAFTLQIGDPNVIAAETGIPVVADFRRMDMALGGQGAPLVPAFHDAIFRSEAADRVVVNIGGIANLTVLQRNQPVFGYDTGPGNTLLDGWARRVLGEPMDQDGKLAASGKVVPALLERCLHDPFFTQPPPKSTGPEYFSSAWLERQLNAASNARDADVQATLTAVTAASIADAILRAVPAGETFVCGGGAHNGTLMSALRQRLPRHRVSTTDELGVAVDWVEAMAFAWLARQRINAQPGNCPQVTGARRPAVLGGLYLPA